MAEKRVPSNLQLLERDSLSIAAFIHAGKIAFYLSGVGCLQLSAILLAMDPPEREAPPGQSYVNVYGSNYP